MAPRALLLLGLLALAGAAALLGSAGATRAQDPPATTPLPAPAPAAGEGMAPPAAAADPDAPVTILYTIHNAGYIEPCG